MVDCGIPSRNPLQKFLVAVALLLSLCFPAHALQTVVLAWSASPDPTVVGYIISYGTNSGTYDDQIDASSNTTIEVTDLVEGQTNYFVVSGYNAQGMQGAPSPPVVYVVPQGSTATQSGSLQVTLNVAGAQWAVDNGTLQNNGAIVSGLSVGSHTVTFSPVSGWTTPASETISIADNQTNSITGTYMAIAPVGALQVKLNVAGAQWAVDNGTLQNSGAVVTDLSVGSHTITFSSVTGWTAPASETISIADNQTNSITGTYMAIAPTGAMQVTLNVSGAEWAVDNGTFQSSGTVVTGLSVGSHTVTFSSVSGWTTPASQTVSVVANQTTSITATYVAIPPTGALKVTLNVTGAQWAVDNGTLQTNGATVAGLSVGSHTVKFTTVSGWTTPASQTVSIVANQTNSITGAYVVIPPTGALQVTLNLAGAQWAVDNGALQTNGATVTGLSVGSHTVTFTTVSGWTTPASQTVSIVANQTNSITQSYVVIPPTGALQVTLNVTNAQWAVDNGIPQTNGATVSSLSVGSHTVTFGAVTGWTAPASQTISIVANQTNSITGTYVAIPQTGSLEVTLSPAMAQWSVDNGALQNSGAIVNGLSVGFHTVTFTALSGWTAPASQTVSIVANQTNSITESYVVIPPTGALQVTLNVTNTQWAVDNGTPQTNGATVSGLSVGSHTVTFAAISGWTTPASQTISIVANQTNSITGTYVAIPQTGSLEVTLSPTLGQWSVDNGALQNSGAIVNGLSVGFHTVTFTALSGWTAPASQTVSIVANQTNSITESYVVIPPTGALQVTLNVTNAQWAVDNGIPQTNGATVSGLSVGSHTVTFAPVSGWTTPANQTISIVANQTNSITGTYVAIPQTGSLEVTVSPAVAQWSVDNGALLNNGAVVSGLSVGLHTVTFTAVSGWTAPASQTVSIVANQTNSITGTYVVIPPTGALQVTLNVTNAQWAVDNGIPQTNGATVSGLSVGSHTVTFAAISGWTTPASQTISIVANQTNSITGTYVAIPQTGSLEVTLSPTLGQWSVDNGALQNSGAVVNGLSVGFHTVTFTALSGWTAPASQTVSIVANQTNSITESYVVIPPTGALQVTLNVTNAQWAVDNGIPQTNGATVSGLSVGSHTVTFGAVTGWTAPASQTISIVANQTNSITGTYVAIPQTGSLEVTLSPAAAQWSVDNGALQNNGAIVNGLSVGFHTVTFTALSGWTAPASQTVSIVANQTNSITGAYVVIPPTGALQVTLNVTNAQWAVDNGTPQTNGATVSGLSVGSHTVAFAAVSGWTTPANQTISIVANQTNSITETYVAIPQTGSLEVTLSPTLGQWSVDNAALQNSGAIVNGLSVGLHTVTFTALSGWTAPASQTVSIVANQTNSITGTYVVIPPTGALQVTLNVTNAQWAVDNGTPQTNGATVSGLSVGSHTVTFAAISGWTTPASQTISIVANQTNSITGTYVAISQTGSSEVGSLEVTVSPAVAQWSVDNGALQNSGAIVNGLSVGFHTVTFTALSGWTAPASQTVSIVANQTNSITESYVVIPPTGALQVTLNVTNAQWAVDNGIPQTNGATVSGLSVGSHTVTFAPVSGWTTPANQTISIVANQTNSITGTYVAIPQTGSLEVTVSPAVAQWSVDNGALLNNGAVVSGLSVGLHTVTFTAVSGWTAPASQTVSIVANQTNSITGTYVVIPPTGALQVTLNVTNAQWAVDNGIPQTNGATVSGLSVGSHTVTFAAISGWTTPASQTISIVANQTNSITGTYVAIPQTGSLEVTLSPTLGQWSVDNGALQNSGAVVNGLSVGFHTVTFTALSGWTAPASQTVSIVANQTNSITESYVVIPPTGALQVTLNVTNAQWAVDNGIPQTNGATVSGLSVGSHTVTFGAVTGWTAPASQTISIVANQTNSITGTYVAIPQTGSLEVTLSPAAAQWSVDNGALQNNGAIVNGLSVGFHTVTFTALSGWTAPASQTVSIVANQTNSITGAYVVIPPTGALQVTLNVTNAQWAVDNGTPQTNGATVAGLSVGSHTVTFAPVTGWTTPANQTISIVANQTNSTTGTYVAIPQTGSLEATLSPTLGQWSVDNGTLLNSGAVVSGLSVGLHTVTFTAVSGWTAPAGQTVSIVANQTNSITGAYVFILPTGALHVALNVAAAQWTVDNGTPQTNGATVSGLSVGLHTVTFAPVTGWTAPASQSISIAANQTKSITETYAAIPQTGFLEVTLSPTLGQWSVDNGALQYSGAIVNGLSVGFHTVTFAALSGWTAPASQTVSIVANQTNSVTESYVVVPPTGALQATLNVTNAQWAVDNGTPQTNGATVSGLSVGSHTVTFAPVSGWTTPVNQTISIVANQTNSTTGTYVAIPKTGSLEAILSPTLGQWSVDNGALLNSGAVVSGLSVGLHTVTFTAVSGWTAPARQTVSIVANQTNSTTGAYVFIMPTGALQVMLNVAGAQWAVDSGALQNSGAVVSGLSVGSHTVTFAPVSGCTTPATRTVSIVANQTDSITGTYMTLSQTGSLEVTLSPAVTQWSVDGGVLQNSGAVVNGLSAGLHTVTFTALSGWTTPASQTVSIAANQTNSITGTYVVAPPAGALQVALNVAGAQWAVDNGMLQTNGATVAGLSAGSHTVTFSPVSGWTAAASQTVSIVANQTNSITGTYVAISGIGSLEVTLNPTLGQWSVDNGALLNSGAVVNGLSVGFHTVTFAALSGWTAPASQTVAIVANQTNSITGTYVFLPPTGALQVSLNVAGAQWSVDNGPLQTNGATVADLSVGSHTVTFSPVSGWTTPATRTVSIVANQTKSVTGTYMIVVLPTGDLQVSLNVAGAQWAVDNGLLHTNGATVAGLSVGSHTVTFSPVSGWSTPASQTVSIVANQTNSITATYVAVVPTGSLKVALNPAVAQWAVDDGDWQNSGAVFSGLSVGLHTVTFSPLGGWTAPASQTVSIVANQTNSITATYSVIPQTGSLEVTLNLAGAQWVADNGALQNSGAILTNLPVGIHTITFSAVTGWTAPATEKISIADDQTNSITATYVAVSPPVSGGQTLNPVTTLLAERDGGLRTKPRKKHIHRAGADTANLIRIGIGQKATELEADVAPVAATNIGGTFNGLFYPADGVTEATSGMLSGLIVKTNGLYSGKILIAGSSLAFTGAFDDNGHVTQVLERSPDLGGELTLDMTLSSNNGLPGIVGTVSGTNGVPWVANLIADPAAASEQSAQFTLAFPISEPVPGEPAVRYCYLTITNYNGSATLVGALADGAIFSQHVPISADGSLPLYVAVGGNELVMGWITNICTSTPNGEIVWIKGASVKAGATATGDAGDALSSGPPAIAADSDGGLRDMAIERSGKPLSSQGGF